jgi:hypothetical protein
VSQKEIGCLRNIVIQPSLQYGIIFPSNCDHLFNTALILQHNGLLSGLAPDAAQSEPKIAFSAPSSAA